ncbi:MAG: DnaJ domain-containing protein [Marinobacterium sp.]|nr:DnaJ domain-containing protein [Marinobacterium sp.]
MHPLSLILLGTLTLIGVLWLRGKPAPQRRRALLQLLILILVPGLLYMAATGRLHWLGAIIAALLPFARRLLPLLRFLPLFRGLFKSSHNPRHRTDGNQSSITTAVLQMTLDHDSGVMYGTILQGPMEGKELGELEEAEFISLLQYCRQQDAESARVLEGYLDKRFGENWRKDDPDIQSQNTDSTPDSLTRQDAWQVLGLSPGATEAEIIQAHRRLLQKVHPDRGGSHYLAAKINEARDQLLK